jgi:hypothetical protein
VNATITLGGLLVGFALLLREFLPAVWAMVMKRRGAQHGHTGDHQAGGHGFNLREHVPFLIGSTVGMLAICCPGGILGIAAAKILGISDATGDKALAGGVGGGPAVAVTRHAAASLDQYGAMVTLLLVVGLFFLRRHLEKRQKGKILAGLWCGSTLGLSAGAAGLVGAMLIPVVEQLGHALGGQA